VCGKKIGPDPRNFNQRVSLGRNDLLIRTFLSLCKRMPQTAVKVLFLIPTPFQAHSCTERRLRNE
ncbi:hypothetical protein ACH6ZA_25995, partial [Klebsiella pneumoniae]